MLTRAGLVAAGVVFALASLPACAKRSERDALQWYGQHKETIDRIDAALGEALSGALSRPEPECEPAADACLQERVAWRADVEAEQNRLRSDVLPPLLELPGVIGVEVRSGDVEIVGDLGLTPGGHGFRVPFDQGTTVDGRKLGWGEYQTSYADAGGSFGDGKMRSGIELGWRLGPTAKNFRAEAYILAEDEVDDRWRSGLGGPARGR